MTGMPMLRSCRIRLCEE